jgi:hypothetical protein
LVLKPYGIFGSSTSETFSCKPVKDSMSSNCGKGWEISHGGASRRCRWCSNPFHFHSFVKF